VSNLDANDVGAAAVRTRTWIGLVALAGGLLGHVLAAQAIGGTYIAYRDHLAGFALLTVVSGGVLAGLGSRFWPRRFDITMLALGVVQAMFGLLAYVERFSFHG
jgi:hypothetical protein